MSLNTTQADIERAMFELIRLVLVENEYLPDIASGNYPNSDQGDQAWQEAMEVIIATKGYAIQVFGASGPKEKGMKDLPRITVITRRFMQGDVGNPISPQVIRSIEDPNIYQAIVRPLQAVNMQVDIITSAATSAQDRVLVSVVNAALGNKGFLPFIGSTDTFFCEMYAAYDLLDTDDSIIERGLSYEIKDLYLRNDIVVDPDVPKITEITVDTKLPKINGGFETDNSLIITP